MKLELTQEEAHLKQKITSEFTKIKESFKNLARDDELPKKIEDTGKYAHRLHMLLKDRGCPPKHHSYMAENRELPEDHPDFYKHFHPLEDLLAFLEDTEANVDPEDKTIGEEFEFRVYSQRWKNYDCYTLRRTATGWNVEHLVINGPCDKQGDPFLYQNFKQDYIAYPSSVGYKLEHLWEVAKDKGLDKEAVQEALNQIAEWVSLTEQSKPTGGIWN